MIARSWLRSEEQRARTPSPGQDKEEPGELVDLHSAPAKREPGERLPDQALVENSDHVRPRPELPSRADRQPCRARPGSKRGWTARAAPRTASASALATIRIASKLIQHLQSLRSASSRQRAGWRDAARTASGHQQPVKYVLIGAHAVLAEVC